MNKSVGVQLLIYGLLLPALGYLTYHLHPAAALPILITSAAGGALSVIWALRVIAGHRGKALPIITLIPVSFMLLSRTVIWWAGRAEVMAPGRAAAAVVTVMFALSFAMLMRIVYAGVVFDAASMKGSGRGDTRH